MRTLDADFILEKNKPSNKPTYLYTIYDYDGASGNLYYTSWSENIVYDGQTYTAFPISHDSINENSDAQVDSVSITLGNVSRLIQAYLETYDFGAKKVKISQIFIDLLADTDAHIDEIYYIDSYTADENNVEFNLTSKFDVLSVTLPTRTYSRNYCKWKFKSTECGYAGAETTCNKTLTRCRVLANSGRFGGFPSIPSRQIFIS